MRIITLALSGLLALAAAGRYNAEADVRQREQALDQIKRQIEGVEQDVAKARLDLEVLESASRLSELNSTQLRLKTVRPGQLLDEQTFASMIGVAAPVRDAQLPPDADVIGNAIGMADMRLAAREMRGEGENE
ncbi:MAG: hypothetical protein ACWA5T_03145 [Parvularcula sp.]